MLKTIPIQQLRLGMYVQALPGSWFDHAFWRRSFKLDDADDLSKLLASRIGSVTIDTSKGLDVEADADAIEAAASATAPDDATPVHQDTPAQPSVSAQDEQPRARAILQRSRLAISKLFSGIREGKAVTPEQLDPIVQDLAASLLRNQDSLISLLRVKKKDDYTYLHSVAVSALMMGLAREMSMDEAQIRQAGKAGMLLDIGKLYIPAQILNKPGALSEDELNLVKKHPRRGYELLLTNAGIDAICLDVCLHHHEKIDGSGYPDGLKQEQISVFARMAAICDVYDALVSNRPYKAGWEPSLALQRMATFQHHFDPVIFQAFVKSIGIYPIGSMVKLTSGRLAVVLERSTGSLLTPIVKVFFSTRANSRIAPEILDLSQHSEEKIVNHEDPSSWGIHDIEELWSR